MEETPEAFIEYCYTKILGRLPDPEGYRYYSMLLKRGVPPHEIIKKFLDSDEFNKRHNTLNNPGIRFAPPGHFYSPLPDVHSLKQVFKKVNQSVTGIDIKDDRQIDFLKKISPYYAHIPFGDGFRKNNTRYFFNGNEWYSYGDAIILFCMINHFKPRRFIEIGSGYSSLVTLDTCEMLNIGTKITLIEPYPDLLLSLLSHRDDPEKILLKKSVEDVDVSFFKELKRGDILFVDSSHVVKFASDVLFIFSEVLPLLNSGVIIHFHDIFWPFEYPYEWLEQGRAWNEAYFLRLLLMNNKNFEILYFNDYMGQKHRDLLEKYIPLASKNHGCGLWMEKILERG